MTAARDAELWVEAAHTLKIVLPEALWGFFGSQLLSVCMPVIMHGFGSVKAHSGQSRSCSSRHFSWIGECSDKTLIEGRQVLPGALVGLLSSAAGCQWLPDNI